MSKLNIEEKNIIDKAISIMENKFKKNSVLINSAELAKKYCQLQIGMKDREHFGVLFLDTQNQLIVFEVLFKGGISGSEVHPRTIARQALLNNANAVIITHNHPSYNVTPSTADKKITERICKVLSELNIAVLDHIIVGSSSSYSFAETGLL